MKKIKFIPVSMNNDINTELADKYLDVPIPIKRVIPDWYKKTEMFIGGKPDINNYGSNAAIKACIPFLDSMTSGYTIQLWTDILVEKNGDEQMLRWLRFPDPIGMRQDGIAKGLPIPAGHSDVHYVWNIPWATQTPDGYSVLITHPLNRFDLPFTTLSGIIDSDRFSSGGLYPFFLKKDFEGIIPAGTPLMQIIPFKRENWESEKDKDLSKKAMQDGWKTRSVVSGFYKKNRWAKKQYD
jgi:hypothetical protein